MIVSLLPSWKPHKMCAETLRTGLRFSETIDLRGPMPRFTQKMNFFWSIFLETLINVCWNPHYRDSIVSKTINLRGHMPRIYSKNECFPIYLLRNPIYVSWNPHNRAHFSKLIDLRGHMPRFTQKMNVFPSISLETHLCLLKPSEQS